MGADGWCRQRPSLQVRLPANKLTFPCFRFKKRYKLPVADGGVSGLTAPVIHPKQTPAMTENKNQLQKKFTSFTKLATTPAETERIARDFAAGLQPGDVVAFFGDLGSGKTFFIKSLCRALGTVQEATSPSFTIINEYFTPDDLFVYHFDFYRLEDEQELRNLGLDEFFYNDYICLIEWADKILLHLPENRWEVWLQFVPHQPESRNISIFKKTDEENER